MSSFLCFVCHSTVNEDTNEETREKYREVIGMNLCPDSHLCYICCYFLNKMCMFKSICLKRTLEYPVLFSEKGTINLQRSLTTVSILCPEDLCLQHLNTRYHFYNDNENSQSDFDDNNYCELQDDRNFELNDRNFDLNDNQNQWNDTLLKTGPIDNFHNDDYLFVTKDSVVDNLFNEELMIPNIEPVRITQNDLVNGKWTENISKNDKHNTLLELNSRTDFDRIICPVMVASNQNQQIAVNDMNIQHNLSAINNRAIDFFNDKTEQVISCNMHQNYQNIPINIQNINYNPKSCYEHIENHVNENIENNIYVNRQSCRVNENLNEPVNKVNVLTNLNVSVITNNSVTEAIESETSIVKPLITINDSMTKTNECEEKLNVENNANVYETTDVNVNDRNEIENNIEEHVDEINVNNLNEPEPVVDLNETEINTNENHSNETEIYENENASDVENPSESETTEEKKSKTKKKKKKDLYEKILLSLEEQKAELDRARKEDKYVTADFKCHNCAMYFHFKDTYQAHMMRHEESNGEHSCSICSLRFANPAVLRSHSANHSVRYQCRVCCERVRARQRATHATACAGESVTCHLCGREFPCSEYYQQHLQRYHGRDSNKSYLCNVCGKCFNSRARVRTHMITHINRKFNCDQCPAVFSSPYTLNNHKKCRHETTEPQVHQCTTCSTTYNSRKSLLAHLRNSLPHKDSLYKCGVCGRNCASAAALTRHAASVHARTNHLACRHCNKHYSTTKSLMQHMTRNHKEGKPIPLCHSCGMSFKSTTILKRHLKNVCEKDRKCQSQNILEEELLQVPYYE